MDLAQASRRVLLFSAGSVLSCVGGFGDRMQSRSDATARDGLIAARPHKPALAGEPGLQTIALGKRRNPILYVPSEWTADTAMPLVASLHGAGGEAQGGIDLLRPLAEEYGFLLLAPSSQDATWDVIASSFGKDVVVLNEALAWIFTRYSVARVAIAGFSDGASYALSLGITNGDLFSHVLAFSPGFVASQLRGSRPVLFISHGTEDRVLPIDRCSRSFVPRLKQAGYEIRYEEFSGGHTAPEVLRREAVKLFLGR
jgi:phospholipase/carboxylesterase